MDEESNSPLFQRRGRSRNASPGSFLAGALPQGPQLARFEVDSTRSSRAAKL
jgi:hypothetical protein